MKGQKQVCHKYEYWLASLVFLPGRKKISLETMFGSAETLYHADKACLRKILFLTEREKEGLIRAVEQSEDELEQLAGYCKENHIELLLWHEEEYPQRLREIYNPPYGLFYRGRLPDISQRTVGVVGARTCSGYGKITAEKIGQGLALAEVAVVSGMAAGIDSAVQKGALRPLYLRRAGMWGKRVLSGRKPGIV